MISGAIRRRIGELIWEEGNPGVTGGYLPGKRDLQTARDTIRAAERGVRAGSGAVAREVKTQYGGPDAGYKALRWGMIITAAQGSLM